MTANDLAAVADVLGPLVREYVASALTDIRERLAIVEQQAVVGINLEATVGQLRERVAVAEVRQLIPGPAGADGLGFEDVRVTYDGERTLTLAFERAGRSKTFPITLPMLRYQGVWESKTYDPGDVVTHAGSAWHCRAATSSKPGDGPSDWQLMVKRGQQGSPGLAGRDSYQPQSKVS